MLNPVTIKSFVAGGTITKHRIVKFGSDDDTVVQAAAATDAILGVSTSLDAASAERVDVILNGIAEVEYGGNVTRGDYLTADSNGKAVAAAPAQGVNNRVLGIAYRSGVSGDIGAVLITQSVMQGA